MGVGQQFNLPPIIEVEPFENDNTGAIFKTYPRHIHFDGNFFSTLPEVFPFYYYFLFVRKDESGTKKKLEAGEEEEEEEIVIGLSQYSKLGLPPTTMGDEEEYALRNQEYGGEGEGEGGEAEGDEEEDEEEEEEEEEQENVSPDPDGSSLTAIQKNYGISPDEDLIQWQGFRSNLMELLYADDLVYFMICHICMYKLNVINF
jgi:hypothetical protein